jgi:hypothetical protein
MKRRAVVDEVIRNHEKNCSTFTFKLQKGLKGQVIHQEGFVNCYWESKNKLVYMHIDKCGSTSITTAFNTSYPNFIPLDKMPRAKNPDFLAKYFVESGHTFFSVTRDPVGRWVSGLNEFMCRYRPPLDWVLKQIKSKKYVYDEHTAPQKIFLRLCFENNGNIVLLKMDENLSEKVNNFIRDNIIDELERFKYKPFEIMHLRNSKHFVPNYTKICEKIYEDYIEPDPEEFNKLYEDDFKLYEQGI